MTAKKRTKKPRPKTPEDLNWEKTKTISGVVYHRHRSGEWLVEPTEVFGYSGKALGRPHYVGRYVGQARTDPPILMAHPTVIKAKRSVQEFIDGQASKTDDLREQAVLSLRLGRTALAIDIVFDYIDKRFDELEKDLDERFESLRISME